MNWNLCRNLFIFLCAVYCYHDKNTRYIHASHCLQCQTEGPPSAMFVTVVNFNYIFVDTEKLRVINLKSLDSLMKLKKTVFVCFNVQF